MYYRNDVIRYLQSYNILALKLDHAVAGVREAVSNHIDIIGAGATRAIYYTSCFTDEYQDVCKGQLKEDVRFTFGIAHLFQNVDVVYEMLKLYFEEIFKNKTSEQLERIKRMLMAVNVHIAASTLSNHGFALAVATTVALGMNLSLEMSILAGRTAGVLITITGIYGLIQKAADSAQRLHYINPVYYSALYAQELEMMYFLIEPLFERVGAFKSQWNSDSDIVDVITKMVR